MTTQEKRRKYVDFHGREINHEMGFYHAMKKGACDVIDMRVLVQSVLHSFGLNQKSVAKHSVV